jgi:hypothetical protein
MAMQRNQASSLLRALFHMPMAFQTPSRSGSHLAIGDPVQAGPKWMKWVEASLELRHSPMKQESG